MSLVPKNENLPPAARNGGGAYPMAQGGGAKATGFSFTGKDFLHMLRRRKWMIILSVVLFTVASGLTAFLWLRYAPFYTARALLAVNPPKASELQSSTNMMNKDVIERILQSRAQSMQSVAIFEKALDDIRHTQWFAQASQEGDSFDIVDKLLEDVHIGVLPNTNFISVSMRGTNPRDVTDIVNAVSNAAEKDFKDIANRERNETIKLVSTAYKNEEQKKQRSEEDLQLLKKQSVATEATEAPQMIEAMQANLVRSMYEAKEMLNQARQALGMVQGVPDEELATLPDVKMAVDSDRNIMMLQQQLANVEIALASSKTKYGDESRPVQTLKSQLSAVKDKLDAETKKVTAKAVEQAKMTRMSFFKQAEENFNDLSEQVNVINGKLKNINVLNERAIALQGNIDSATQFARQLRARLADLQLLMQGEQPLVLMRPAVEPRFPSFPTYTVFIPLGVFLGLVFGVGLAFLLEIIDTSIKAPSDVSRRVELPMLGMIPHLDDVEEDIDDLRTAFLTKPNTIVCEAFRQVRTTLMFSKPERMKTILVTSPMPEDGRTSVSLNLGNHLAIGNKRVLVVDANFRQPAMHQVFPDGPAAGLSDVLQEKADWHDLLQEVRPGLFVMNSGPIPANPVELLGSEQMTELVQQLSEEFDHVIFDSAPLLVVSDAAVLSTRTDGTILVVRAGINTYGIAQRARDMLTKLGSHIYGVVLNGVRVHAGGYLRKSYETFYEYRDGAKSPAGAIVSKVIDQDVKEDNEDSGRS